MASEEDEVHALLSRHRSQIIRDLNESKLVAVLVQKGVLNSANEKLFNELTVTFATPTTSNDNSDGVDCVGMGPTAATIESVAIDDVWEQKCSYLIEMIAKHGFEKFKEFCYAIESECPQLIEDLINDRLKTGKFLFLISDYLSTNKEQITRKIALFALRFFVRRNKCKQGSEEVETHIAHQSRYNENVIFKIFNDHSRQRLKH